MRRRCTFCTAFCAWPKIAAAVAAAAATTPPCERAKRHIAPPSVDIDRSSLPSMELGAILAAATGHVG